MGDSRIEAAIRRYRPVIGHGPRLRKAGYRTAGYAEAHILNRTLELGRPICVCIAWTQMGPGVLRFDRRSMQRARYDYRSSTKEKDRVDWACSQEC
jgi:hypothetical protein